MGLPRCASEDPRVFPLFNAASTVALRKFVDMIPIPSVLDWSRFVPCFKGTTQARRFASGADGSFVDRSSVDRTLSLLC